MALWFQQCLGGFDKDCGVLPPRAVVVVAVGEPCGVPMSADHYDLVFPVVDKNTTWLKNHLGGEHYDAIASNKMLSY